MAKIKPICIPKSSGAVLVQPSEYKGVQYIDVRNFYKDRNSDDLKPTPKGIMVPLDKVEEVAHAMLTQLKAFKSAAPASADKVYVVTTKTLKSGVEARVAAGRVFEDMASARKFSGKGPATMYAVIGEFSVCEDYYLWEAPKVRKVAVRENGVWTKIVK